MPSSEASGSFLGLKVGCNTQAFADKSEGGGAGPGWVGGVGHGWAGRGGVGRRKSQGVSRGSAARGGSTSTLLLFPILWPPRHATLLLFTTLARPGPAKV